MRKGDILTDLAASINDTTADYRPRVQALKILQQELDNLTASFEDKELKEFFVRQGEALEQMKT